MTELRKMVLFCLLVKRGWPTEAGLLQRLQRGFSDDSGLPPNLNLTSTLIPHPKDDNEDDDPDYDPAEDEEVRS